MIYVELSKMRSLTQNLRRLFWNMEESTTDVRVAIYRLKWGWEGDSREIYLREMAAWYRNLCYLMDELGFLLDRTERKINTWEEIDYHYASEFASVISDGEI